ncbi:MAG: phosphate/phosphite/phosphonate ABC transporter substrate-binding protein [Gemmatimonadota bacterium]|jgi:phosphonate transport system substrate-binding protein|nr:phosphate/phosphite/phosphonate ABC transporter substrate-binding protein [Gemmatimonadota bacterium]
MRPIRRFPRLALVCAALLPLLAACGGDAAPGNTAAAGAADASAAPAAETGPFRLGFLPAERAAEFTAKADTLAVYLQREMGTEVEVFVPTAYEPLIEALRFGNLDAAFMDAAPAWIAHQRAGAEVVLAERREDGSTFYWGTGFTRVGSDIDSLSDLVGKRVAHTSWTGSSGFVLPIGTMVQQGLIRPAGDQFPQLQQAMAATFASYTMAGGYKPAMELLARDQVDAAFGADDAPERFLKPADRARVRPFVRLGRVPSHPLVVARHVSPARREAFTRAMLKLTEERPDIYRALYGVAGVVPATTEEHLADFGRAVAALPGLHAQFLETK